MENYPINPDPKDPSLWQGDRYMIRGFLVRRTRDCPEEYEAGQGEIYGGPDAYLRVQRGQLRTELGDGTLVHRVTVQGEDVLQTDERGPCITNAVLAIQDHYADWMSGRYEIDGFTLFGGGACPEQYDVWAPGEEGDPVGYMRLRHGFFYAEVGEDNVVYEAEPMGDGEFRLDEREKYLTEAVHAIAAYLARVGRIPIESVPLPRSYPVRERKPSVEIVDPDPTDLTAWQGGSYCIRGFYVRRKRDSPEEYEFHYGEIYDTALAYVRVRGGQVRADLRDGGVVLFHASTSGGNELQLHERAKYISEATSALEAYFSEWMSGHYVIDGYTLRGGGAYPEQYDVWAPGDEEPVAYMRLRFGRFFAGLRDDKIVYEAKPGTEGELRLDERARYLTEAVRAIAKCLKAKASS